MSRVGELVAFFLLTVLAAFAVRTMLFLNYFDHVLNHSPGHCIVKKASGAEAIEVLPNGLAFISSGLRYPPIENLDPVVRERKGKLMTMFIPHREELWEIPLKSFDASDFNPHGLSLFTDPRTGDVSVFVINHKSNGSEVIEIFDFSPESNSLVHRRSVMDPKIYSPNDVLAVGRESFYVTNDHYFGYDSPLFRTLEVLLLNFWLRTDVIYFDGERSHVATSGLKGANGINQDVDERFVFASSGYDKGMNIYERQSDNTLKLVQAIHLGSCIDNINVDVQTGDLWLAGSPNVLRAVQHFQNVSLPAPAQVISIRLNQYQPSAAVPFPDYEAREVYLNDGSELKTSSAAVVFNGTLVIGSVDGNVLLCDVKAY